MLLLLSCSAATLHFVSAYTQNDGSTIPICDIRADVRAEAWSGDCPTCDWAFEVQGTVTSDLGSADCYPSPTDLFVSDGDEYVSFVLAHSDYYVFEEEYGDERIDNDYYHTAWVDPDGEAHWNYAVDANGSSGADGLTVREQLGSTCSPDDGSQSGPFGGEEVFGEIPISTEWGRDTWSFSNRTGGPVSITVDTVADDTSCNFDFRFYDPDDCYQGDIQGGFDCTFVPDSGSCPTVQFERAQPADYQVEVRRGNCGSDHTVAAYVLRVEVDDGNAGLNLLEADGDGLYDDGSYWAEGTRTLSGLLLDE